MQEPAGPAKRKLKITFALHQPGLAGGVRVAAIYADLLAKRGHDVSYVFTGKIELRKRDRLMRWLGAPSAARSFEISPYLTRTGLPYRQFDYVEQLNDKHFPDADIVIATFWPTAHWVADLSPSKGAKVYLIQHHETTFEYDPDAARKSYALPLRKITISKWLADLMAREYGDPDVPVIHNSVDTELFYAPPRQKNQETFNIGLLYSTIDFKGVPISLDAIRLLKRSTPNAKVIAFGAEQPSESLPLPDNAEFFHTPAQDDIRKIYAKCDVWLCGSHAEGFHLPPLEAMACRCPVVSTRVGGPVDIVKEGVNGFLADVGDIETLAEKLGTVADMSDQDWRAMSDAAYETAVSYTWSDATALFEAELFRLLDGNRETE